MFKTIFDFIKETYGTNDFIPLHAPSFIGNESKYVQSTIDSTFVSSVGEYVNLFETMVSQFTGATRSVATVNGTAALHAALHLAGVRAGDFVITQAFTFVATCNAISYIGAEPIFVDISASNLGMCPSALIRYLNDHAIIDCDGCTRHKSSGRKISAVVPMHTFGHPVNLDELTDVCTKWNITVVEDAAESLGSFYKGTHTGLYSKYSAISFNGNKIITTGGGGMILCKNMEDGERAKHITTTAKVPHPYEFYHDNLGFNYRLPNLNAALGCAQMELLPMFLKQKRNLAQHYKSFFRNSEYEFVEEPAYAKSNYWLNAILCPNESIRNKLISSANSNGVMMRPAWKLMHKLPMYSHAPKDNLDVSEMVESRLVNIPSSPIKL